MTPRYVAPGVHVQEVAPGPRLIQRIPTSVTAFVGRVPLRLEASGGVDDNVAGAGESALVVVRSLGDFERHFGGTGAEYPLRQAVHAFFLNGGQHALIVRVAHGHQASGEPTSDLAPLTDTDYLGGTDSARGLRALHRVDHFNLLCIPPDVPGGDVPTAVYRAALELCAQRRAMLLLDAPLAWLSPSDAEHELPAWRAAIGADGVAGRNGALYFPRLLMADGAANAVPQSACGAVAGVIARIDAARGVWKAPAGREATLRGVAGLSVTLTNEHQGRLNPLGVNCMRHFPAQGHVVWGARTLRGADGVAEEFRYLSVRRLALHVEQSLVRGLAWVVFEPSEERTWTRVRAEVDSILHGLWREGALMGQSPRDAYFVKCDRSSMTGEQIARGEVVVLYGMAMARPAEFLVTSLGIAAQSGVVGTAGRGPP